MSRFGSEWRKTISTNFRPNEPVPPVTTTDLPSRQLAAIWLVESDPMYERGAERRESATLLKYKLPHSSTDDMNDARLALHGGSPVRTELLPYGRHDIDD